MDKVEFELWKKSLTEDQKQAATSFFAVIKRQSELSLDSSLYGSTDGSTNHSVTSTHDLYSVPFSQEYNDFPTQAADLLHKVGDLASSPSLKRFFHSKADAFLSNDYYDSDIAWMELDSKLDVTIGPYETYEDALFGYKDVKGPQTAAFNLPNDERIVKDRGTSMVMLKNISEAKLKHILQPIADVCITKEQQELVDFESFFTHTICHECCHGIRPHSITLPDGRKSTVRLELQELHSTLEEAKADIVGLWA